MREESKRNRMATVNGLVVGLTLSFASLANAAGFSFTEIAYPGPGDMDYTAANANSTHQIAGEFFLNGMDTTITHGFVLDKGNFSQIDVPDAVSTTIKGVTENGTITGTYWTGEYSVGGYPEKRTYGYLLRKGAFTTIDPPNSIQSQGGAVNAQGQVVGTYRTSDQKYHGFIWYKGAYTTFNVPNDAPVLGTEAHGMNDRGQIVGNYVDASTGKRHGFLLSEGAYTTLDVPNAVWTVAQGINNSGQIVGSYFIDGYGDQGEYGFVFSDGVYTKIRMHSAVATQVNSISEQGAIVGSFWDVHYNYARGFVGTPIQ